MLAKNLIKTWFARLFISCVILVNLLCAFEFIFKPEQYLASFEFTAIDHQPIIQGIGILFLMWNIPYLVAVINPLFFKISLLEAIIMQFIGFGGELILLALSPNIPLSLKETVIRFSVFDGSGFCFLIAAMWLVRNIKQKELA